MAKLSIVYDVLNISCNSLAALDAAASASKIDGTRERGFRVVKTDYFCYLNSGTATDVVVVGMGGPDLAPAEIEEAIEADPQHADDPVASEHVMRRLWPLEMIKDDTEPVKGSEKLNWSYPEGTVLNWWVYNPSAAALNASATVTIFAKHYGVWLND